jgi:hypothetical protein
MNTRAASWLAWSLWALYLALTALSLVLLFLNLSHPDVPVYSFWAENALYSVGFLTVGVVIVPRILREGKSPILSKPPRPSVRSLRTEPLEEDTGRICPFAPREEGYEICPGVG